MNFDNCYYIVALSFLPFGMQLHSIIIGFSEVINSSNDIIRNSKYPNLNTVYKTPTKKAGIPSVLMQKLYLKHTFWAAYWWYELRAEAENFSSTIIKLCQKYNFTILS